MVSSSWVVWALSAVGMLQGRGLESGEQGLSLGAEGSFQAASPAQLLSVGPRAEATELAHSGWGAIMESRLHKPRPALLPFPTNSKFVIGSCLLWPQPGGSPLIGLFPWDLAIGVAKDGAGVWVLTSLAVWTVAGGAGVHLGITFQTLQRQSRSISGMPGGVWERASPSPPVPATFTS